MSDINSKSPGVTIVLVLVMTLGSSCTSIEEGLLEIGHHINNLGNSLRAEVSFENSRTVSLSNASDMRDKRIDVSEWRTGIPDPRSHALLNSFSPAFRSGDRDAPRRLAEQIAEIDENPFAQAKILHDVLALYFTYDWTSFRSTAPGDQNPLTVLQKGSAVCQGYADSFSLLAGYMNLEVRTVSGYARGIGSDTYTNENPRESNHAWNVLSVDGAKYIIDVTWDSDEYSTDYLFLYPEQAIFSRLPERSQDQYLDEPYSPSGFSNLPFIKGAYFSFTETSPPAYSRIMELNGYSKIILPGTSHLKIIANWIDTNGRNYDSGIFNESEGDDGIIYLAPPVTGQLLLRVFAARQDEREYRQIVDFGVISNWESTITLPQVYESYKNRGCRFLSDPAIDRSEDGEKHIRLLLPDAQEAFLQINNSRQRIPLVHQGDSVFSAIIDNQKGFTIYARYPLSSSFEGIARYL